MMWWWFRPGARRCAHGLGCDARTVRQDGKERPPAVWLTGHSLGGGYANCVMLHLLANKSCSALFGGGGGALPLPPHDTSFLPSIRFLT